MKNIIVIDDDVDILKMLHIILTAEGYHVNCFTNWYDGYNQINISKPSLIIIDVNLGNGDGRKVSKLLKFKSDTHLFPVCLISGDCTIENEFSSYDADEFISKPFKNQFLIERVNFLTRNFINS